jgi:class 3 adenylate cyclase
MVTRESLSKCHSGQTLVPQRVLGRVEDMVESEPVGELTLKGFQRAVSAFNVTALKITVVS